MVCVLLQCIFHQSKLKENQFGTLSALGNQLDFQRILTVEKKSRITGAMS